ncbi:hypothetical protein CAPTEDRAFT_166461 [Capitella teleta]|uniref:Uncharacterized protein n=1 Tax=Capitella teleta TaxID=283909 RepID=R7T5J1_CAPTE|nr:hypothetical protein CAPTEDRAFT_166461 [Capitella teleta]|eukprot:ELT88306.1 hypothetical protein CAPTEDRAFT_166461 [Capitella teleta]
MKMAPNSTDDPRRPIKVHRFKAPAGGGPAEDITHEYMNLLGMIFSMCGLMMKMKWCGWSALFCAFISFSNSRSSEDPKQILSAFMLSFSAIVMAYLHNPQPMSPPWS